WLAVGHYRVLAHADGHVDQTVDVDASSREPRRVEINLVPVPVATPPPPTPSAPPPSRSKLPAIVTTAATAICAATSVAFYLHATHLNDQAAATTDYNSYKALRASTLDWKHASWVAGGAAGIGAIASALLWYRA